MKSTIVSIIIAIALIAAANIFSGKAEDPINTVNTEITDGIQKITIEARGGYTPRFTNAKAGLPTKLTIKTQNTFDCSSALVIPDLSYRKNLPPTGTVEIDVPAQEAGSVMRGFCSMGMYNFEIRFN
jgi:plastocyanin domain-containing protein